MFPMSEVLRPVTLSYAILVPAWKWVEQCATDITFTNFSTETLLAGLMDTWPLRRQRTMFISNGNGVPAGIIHRSCGFFFKLSGMLPMLLKVLKPAISINQLVLHTAQQSIDNHQSISWLAHSLTHPSTHRIQGKTKKLKYILEHPFKIIHSACEKRFEDIKSSQF